MDSFEIFLGGQKITNGTKTIIDDILLQWSKKLLLLLYLEYMGIIFRKNRVIFRLKNYKF